MRTVLLYGDSNTWGTDPASGERFPPDVRWPGVAAAALGSDWHVIEEGLPGRTTVLDNPLRPYRNGRDYLVPCVESHAPLDCVVIFLGTNDLADRYAMPPLDIAHGAAVLGDLVRRSETGPAGTAPAVLLLGIPRVGPFTELADTFASAQARAAELPRCFRLAAEELDLPLLDLSEHVAYSPLDGLHLDADGHRAVGELVAQRLLSMF